MKKVLLVAVAGLFVLASCKKDYTCDCTVDGDAISIPLKDTKKKDAEAACESAKTTYSIAGPTTCTLK